MASLRSALVRSLFVLGLLGLLTGACRTNSPDPASDAGDDDTTVANASGDTSATAPDSADRSNPPPPPAPGTARIRAEIVACDATTVPVRCEARVVEVLGYGPSTPPLGTGTQSLSLASSLLANRDVAALDTLGTRTFVVRHAGDRPTFGDASDEERPVWTIHSIEP